MTMQLLLTSATLEGAQAIFFKKYILKIKTFKQKRWVCHGSKVKKFTKCLCTVEGN